MKDSLHEPAVLYHKSGIRVVRSREQVVELTVGRKWGQAILFLFLMPIMAVCATGFSYVALEFLIKLPKMLDGGIFPLLLPLLLVGLLSVGTILCTGLCVAGTLISLLRRRFEFDIQAKSGKFQHLPWNGFAFSLDDIESITLGSGTERGWNLAWLCLSMRDWKKLFRIQGIARHKTPQDAMMELKPAADILADLLKKPINYQENLSAFDTSWR